MYQKTFLFLHCNRAQYNIKKSIPVEFGLQFENRNFGLFWTLKVELKFCRTLRIFFSQHFLLLILYLHCAGIKLKKCLRKTILPKEISNWKEKKNFFFYNHAHKVNLFTAWVNNVIPSPPYIYALVHTLPTYMHGSYPMLSQARVMIIIVSCFASWVEAPKP